MTTKQKELRKQRIKNTLLKTLHVFCYILSLLFVIVCIVGGVKSCEKKPQNVSAEEDLKSLRIKKALNPVPFEFDDSYYTLACSFDLGLNTIPYNVQRTQGLELLNIDIYEPVASSWYSDYFFDLGEGAYLIDGQNLRPLSSLILEFRAYTGTGLAGVYYPRIKYLCAYDTDGTFYRLMERNSSDVADYTYNFINNHLRILVSNNLYDNRFIQYYYHKQPITSFIFNKQFNYNAPLNTNINGLYGSMTFDSSGANIRWKNYDVGYFVSNGLIFNRIQYTCIYSEGTSLLFNDGQVLDAPSGYWVYGWLTYINTDNNYSEIVNRHDQIPFQHNGGTSLYYANSSTWINDQYRYIKFLEPLSDSISITINSFNNNNQNYYSGQIYTEGGDVFTLLSYGFSSLSGFWSLNILPGISLGVLFFLPAVVGIIITIVHMLRK